eukprot:jgi/Chrzof1/3903/Cz13g12220.t1
MQHRCVMISTAAAFIVLTQASDNFERFENFGNDEDNLFALCTVGHSATAGGAPAAQPVDTGNGPLAEYIEQAEKGRLKSEKALNDLRSKYGIRRAVDGRVELRSKAGDWYQVRLDMEVPGALLFRDSQGRVYAIESDVLRQIDLSDDYVLLMLFANGQWESQIAPVEYEEDGQVKQLTLTAPEFREFVGLLNDAEEDNEPAASGKK